MAITNQERVRKGLELLREGLVPFVEREMKTKYQEDWFLTMRDSVSESQAENLGTESSPKYDSRSVLAVVWNQWNDVFRVTLGSSERSMVNELRGVGNKLAHEQPFSGDDTYRALDSIERLLLAVSAAQSEEAGRMKQELLRLRFDEQVRNEKKKEARGAVESSVTGTLKPWREVVSPHPDVAAGNYSQAEFAADLWQVHLGEGSPEYRDPVEFFRRTFMTESLQKLLVAGVRRLTTGAGDPVVQLQTNFGGGKTHSMLALYHLVSGRAAGELLGADAILQAAGVAKLPAARRVVLVGNKISPGNPVVKADGTVVKTLWGELAYQLGGKEAFDKIRADDEKATSPGDRIRELLNEYGPTLILVDEWVAYARQLHDEGDLDGGSFETQFSFAQALTESAKLAKNCVLVVSLPASDGSSDVEDIEVGGARGRAALDRLRTVVGRVDTPWQPATADESFEIVRRRLFEPLSDPEQFKSRDVVVRAFCDLYRTQRNEFPLAASEPDYEERMKMAYPFHPELFDQLYGTWSTIARFQRTRGVLRLMAKVVRELWAQGDRNPLIMPGNLVLAADDVVGEMTRFIGNEWKPIVAKDIDGESSLPHRIDNEISNLGRFHATRRVARTVFLGSAPLSTVAVRGLEDRTIKLGCVMPGEQPAIFGDALRRLAGTATYLYQDGPRYWYSTQPTVTKLADDRAEQFKRDPDSVVHEIEKRAKLDLRVTGEFSRVHAFPQSGADVTDDRDARLVVLGIEHPYSKEDGNAAEQFAKEILRTRGNAPRLYQNSLAFLAVDKIKLQDLDESVRRFLAWESILGEREILDLSPHQVKQAEIQKASADGSVTARLPEVFQWLLVPVQEEKNPAAPILWELHQLKGDGSLAQRASKKLRDKDLLYVSLSPSRLKMELDRVPLWDGNSKSHVAIAELVDYFAKYLYLPRLKAPGLLLNAVQEGIKFLTWSQDSFAYADSYDEESGRYRGLVCGRVVTLGTDIPDALLVRSDIALQQLSSETAQTLMSPPQPGVNGETVVLGPNSGLFATGEPGKPKTQPTRFHGSVPLDATRVGRDAGRIADEVISHLAGIVGAEVKVTLEIEAKVPDGVSDEIIRIVTQNSRDLKFDPGAGFEE
jgi:predicted AAA+ superfamily ATPase